MMEPSDYDQSVSEIQKAESDLRAAATDIKNQLEVLNPDGETLRPLIADADLPRLRELHRRLYSVAEFYEELAGLFRDVAAFVDEHGPDRATIAFLPDAERRGILAPLLTLNAAIQSRSNLVPQYNRFFKKGLDDLIAPPLALLREIAGDDKTPQRR